MEKSLRNYLKISLTTGVFAWLLLVSGLSAQEIPQGGEELVQHQRLMRLKLEKEDLGKAAVSSEDPNSLEFESVVHPPFIYKLSANMPIQKRAFQKGQLLLLSFEAKTLEASLETGEARALWVLKQSDDHRENISYAVSMGNAWRQYYFPVQLTRDIPEGTFKLLLQFGYPPQKFLLRNVSLLAFDQAVSLEELPKTRLSYAGIEADATWRQEAEARIAGLRKGNVELQFVDKKGRPMVGKMIQIELEKHHFGWGTAVSAGDILHQPEHLRHVKGAFNTVVFENDLKIKSWQRKAKQAPTLEAIRLLQDEGIAIKGHVLVWPGFNYLPENFRTMEEKPEKVEKEIAAHVSDILQATKGTISQWDVVNETYTNQDLQRITGSEEILYNAFRTAKEKAPEALRFTNEYGIISKGGLDKKKQEWYRDFILRVDEHTKGLVDGIGIQCHIGSDLTPPEKVLSILDYYAETGKQIAISEFTMDIPDDEIRYQYTRDFMIAAFSHPDVADFLFWGYYGPKHEKAALFNKDWELAPMGKAFFELVHEQWNTRLNVQTDADGKVSMSGFYGRYVYRYLDKNKVVEGHFELLPEGKGEMQIELP